MTSSSPTLKTVPAAAAVAMTVHPQQQQQIGSPPTVTIAPLNDLTKQDIQALKLLIRRIKEGYSSKRQYRQSPDQPINACLQALADHGLVHLHTATYTVVSVRPSLAGEAFIELLKP
jgi:hypothetical protein